MKIDPAVAQEHDEVVTVTSPKGDVATFKVNHLLKTVHIKTAPGDGNDAEWRHTGGSYESIMALAGRNAQGEVVGDASAPKPAEVLDPFGRPVGPPASDDE